MATILELAGVAVGGAALGAVHFLGLWLTLQRLPRSRHGGMLVLGSSILRIAVTVIGLWLLMAGEPARLLVALASFVVLRVLLGVRLRSPVLVRGR